MRVGLKQLAAATGPTDATIVSSGPDQLVTGTAGADSIVTLGHGDTILGNGGNDSIASSGGSTTIELSGLGQASVDLVISSGNLVTGQDGAITVRSEFGLGSNVVRLGNGNDRVALAGHHNAIAVGNGNDTVSTGLGHDTLTIGTGQSLVFLAPHDIATAQGTGTIDATGGSGDSITTTRTAAETILLHGSGNMVTTGGGSDTIADSAVGHDTFFLHGGGSIVFTSFAASSQIVLGAGDGYASGADALAHAQNVGGGAELHFGSGATSGTVLFAGLNTSNLHATNFSVG